LIRSFPRRPNCIRCSSPHHPIRILTTPWSPRRFTMSDSLYPQATPEIAAQRKKLAPKPNDAFEAFSKAVFEDGALDGRTKQLVAVAVAHVTQCPHCIKAHPRLASKAGASDEQIMEAIWVAAEMRAGGAYAHSSLALDTLNGHSHGH